VRRLIVLALIALFAAPAALASPVARSDAEYLALGRVFPDPDGWRRGSISEGGVFYQRYNGNGIDPNRDWPDLGYTFRPYSGPSEPETRAFLGFYGDMARQGLRVRRPATTCTASPAPTPSPSPSCRTAATTTGRTCASATRR
jgi:hypothetical protein